MFFGESDTIAAIATAPGNSGISIIRISGEHAVLTADRIFKKKMGVTPKEYIMSGEENK